MVDELLSQVTIGQVMLHIKSLADLVDTSDDT